jgi:2-phospho-L-lactate guanylyltransferase
MGNWVLVIPVKRLALAKTRLSGFAGRHREALALAFAADTMAAAGSCPEVNGVVVVTDDPAARDLAHSLGDLVVPDEPDAGLNPALVHGAAAALERWPGTRVAALSSDLPALRAGELSAALLAAGNQSLAFVADAAGTGTTLLAAATLSSFVPRFGPGSSLAHRAAGAVELTGTAIPSLRRDVDTEADLDEAELLGLGPRTASVMVQLRG